MTKLMALTVMNWVTPKAGAKNELLFNKPAFGVWLNPWLFSWRHDTQHIDTQQKGIICDIQHHGAQNNNTVPFCRMSRFIYQNAKYRYAEYCSAEYCYAECRYAEYRYAEYCSVEYRYAECRYAEYHCAERHYAECRYAQYRGVTLFP